MIMKCIRRGNFNEISHFADDKKVDMYERFEPLPSGGVEAETTRGLGARTPNFRLLLL